MLDMGERLGRFITQYRNDYFMPDKRNGEIVYSYKPLPHAEDAIYRRISDITISMKSADHLKMPELVSASYEVQLSKPERERYEDLKQELVLQLADGEVTAANAASPHRGSSASWQTEPSTRTPVTPSSSTTGSWTLWRTSSRPRTGSPCWWPTGSATTSPA